jgi:adenosylhomocysteine nucleosidase
LRDVIAACGLALEASIAAGPGVRTVAGGVDPRRLAAELEREVARGAAAIVSFGIAGALAPSIAAGECIVARGIVIPGSYRRCDDRWTARLCSRLPAARYGDLAGRDRPVADASSKRALYAETSALAVDTESHVAAEIALAHGLPFAALRVVADAADRDLPPAATVALKPGGRVDVKAVLRSLAATPSQLPLLLRTAVDAQAAFAALRRGRRRLGDDLGAFDRDVL